MLRFERPEFLWLMLLAVPTVWAAARWMRSMTPWRRWVSVVLRLAVLMLLAAVLAGATLVNESRRVAVLALVDTSGSMRRFYQPPPEGQTPSVAAASSSQQISAIETVRGYLRQASAPGENTDDQSGRGPDDAMGIIVFDGRALAVATPTRADVLDRPMDVPMSEGTDIAAAVRLATASFPPDAAVRVVLFSDGVETSGDVIETARQAARAAGASADGPGSSPGETRGLPIDVVPMSYRVEHEVSVQSLDVPSHAPEGTRVNVRVTLESTRAGRGTLRLLQEDSEVDINGAAEGRGLVVDVPAGESVHVVPVMLTAARLNRFEAVFEPMASGDAGDPIDTVSENNRATGFTLTPSAGSVLLVSGGGADAEPLAVVLERAGMSVRRVGPAGLSGDLLAMQAHDVVILQNVAADETSEESRVALAAYVEDFGGGLVMIGGPSSLGAGGWKGTPIEPILPVRLDLPEKMISPAAAVMIVLDNSQSMSWGVLGSRTSQMEIACEGAAAAIESMYKTDLLGVIAFNEQHRVVVPLAPNADARRSAGIVRGITPEGGTNLPPALREAGRQLAAVKADVKHVIVLSDGISQHTEQLPTIAGELREQGISVSTIAVGDDADIATMATMAARGGGVHYPVSDPQTLPRVFVKAVRVVREPLIRRQPFTPVRVRGVVSPIWQAAAAEGDAPSLRGLVLTQPRTEPTVTTALIAGAGGNGEPVLAHWQAGLGRVVVFTSDASEWAREWLDWPGYAAMWTSAARWVGRPGDVERRGGELHVEREANAGGGRIHIEYAAGDETRDDAMAVSATVFAPDGTRVPVRLMQTGPGEYSASVPAAMSGNYIVTATPSRKMDASGDVDARPLMPVIGGVSIQRGEEYRRLCDNRPLLETLARESGGRVLDIAAPQDARLFDREGVRPSVSRQSLWHVLLPLALVVLLVDLASRKIAWDRWFQAEFKAALRRERAEAVAARSSGAARTAQRLRRREQQVSEVLDTPTGESEQSRLTTDDARRIVVEQRRRRTEAEKSVQPAVPVAPPPIEKSAEPRKSADAEAEGGLFAAKRRARERMDNDQHGTGA